MNDRQPATDSPRQGVVGVPALRVAHVSKTFPGQRALDDVELEVRRGEIHALVGQNGSGKSTLIKILSGFHTPDPGGEGWLGGEEINLGHPSMTDRSRMLFIHQDRALIDTLSVRENLWLGVEEARAFSPLPGSGERTEARKLLARFDLDIDPDTLVGELSPFEQSAVAITRALGAVGDEAELLVLDEPTASLGATEAERLFETLRRVQGMGLGILYVSHYLSEVIQLADRITVLRDGRRIAVRESGDVSRDELLELIVGSRVEQASRGSARTKESAPPLRVEGLVATGLREAGVAFSARGGEVLGLTGLVGSGYLELAECLGGLREWEAGTVELDGRRFEHLDPGTATAAGIATIPADRLRRGLIAEFSVAENVVLPQFGVSWRNGFINRATEESDVRAWIERTGVQPPDPRRLIRELSGGNQQKVLLAKALRLEPRVLVLCEPTQAVDAGGAAAIRKLIVEVGRDESRAVIVASSDAEELEQICGRVLVCRGGEIVGELRGEEISKDRLLSESHVAGGAA
ncbi:MAG TPA: sugar ABC transporter ATP-binding protein [Solirubrobacterales bacterium]|nr:sugar ABC transporter ATP-binding protein [Solirubrobacterales bacterium]